MRYEVWKESVNIAGSNRKIMVSRLAYLMPGLTAGYVLCQIPICLMVFHKDLPACGKWAWLLMFRGRRKSAYPQCSSPGEKDSQL